jgi:hypothetical protein
MGGNDIQQLNNLYFTTTNQSYIQGSGGNLSIVGNALAQIIVGAGSSVYTSIVQTTTTLDELQTGWRWLYQENSSGKYHRHCDWKYPDTSHKHHQYSGGDALHRCCIKNASGHEHPAAHHTVWSCINEWSNLEQLL